MSLFATLFPLLCWFAYNYGVPLIERRRPSLSVIMTMQRRRWVANAAKRESPLDAILSGNLMQSVSFLASTSMLIVLALFAAFGQVASLSRALSNFGFAIEYSVAEVQVHLLVMLAIFASSFFAFTLSLRQFNHFCILLGAISHDVPAGEDEIEAIAMLNSMAARNFNSGIRAYYFAVPATAAACREGARQVHQVRRQGACEGREMQGRQGQVRQVRHARRHARQGQVTRPAAR